MRKHKINPIKAQNIGYGEYGCARCHTPLVGPYNFVGDAKDEEGHEWRGFCDECWNAIGENSSSWIMTAYPESPYLINDKTPKCKAIILTLKLYRLNDDEEREAFTDEEVQEAFKEFLEMDDIHGWSIHDKEIKEVEM